MVAGMALYGLEHGTVVRPAMMGKVLLTSVEKTDRGIIQSGTFMTIRTARYGLRQVAVAYLATMARVLSTSPLKMDWQITLSGPAMLFLIKNDTKKG